MSTDGTKKLISVTNGMNTTKASGAKQPNDSCVVEPFYVPVNTRLSKPTGKDNFWDEEESKDGGALSLQASVANYKRRAASALAGNRNQDQDKMQKGKSRNGDRDRLNKTEMHVESELDGKIKHRIVRVIRRSRSR